MNALQTRPRPKKIFDFSNDRCHSLKRKYPYELAKKLGRMRLPEIKCKALKPAFGMAARGEITDLLQKVRRGDSRAEEELWERLYPELYRLAELYCRKERAEHTLGPTALINEAYLELVDQSAKEWQSRAHFVAVAAQVMRRVLVDYARRHQAGKRGGGNRQISFNEELMLIPEHADQVIALDEALGRLAAFDPQQSRIVELRFFGGLSERETAELLGLGVRTVTRGWNMAKAWLYGQLKAQAGSG